MKLLSILSEAVKSKFTKIELRYMNFFLKKGYTNEDGSELFSYLKNELYLDYDKSIILTNLFLKNYDEDHEFLKNKNIDRSPDISDDDEIMALAKFLEVPYFTLEEINYTNHGLTQYSMDREEYSIGTDEEADAAYEEVIDDMINNPSEWFSTSTLENCIDASDGEKHELAADLADSSIEGMDDDDILEQSDKQEELDDYDNEISDLESEISDLEEAIADDDRITERNELEEELKEKTIRLNQQQEGRDTFYDNLVESGRESYRDELYDNYKSSLDRNFVGFMQGEMGYDLKTLGINYGYDDDCLKNNIEGSRESELGTDENENSIEYDGTTYYIYRTN